MHSGRYRCFQLVAQPVGMFDLLFSLASRIDRSPVISAKYKDISSRDRPFVSGKRKKKKTSDRKHAVQSIRKKPVQVMASAIDKTLEAIKVAKTRFRNVAILMALARMHVAKTSDGTSQHPGPMPILNVAKYNAKPRIAHAGVGSDLAKLIASIINETIMPDKERKSRFLRPF